MTVDLRISSLVCALLTELALAICLLREITARCVGLCEQGPTEPVGRQPIGMGLEGMQKIDHRVCKCAARYDSVAVVLGSAGLFQK